MLMLVLMILCALTPAIPASATEPFRDAKVEVVPRLHRRAVDSPLRVSVNLVLVPVSVTDGTGRAVQGLGEKHFRVFEEGVEQQIVSFNMEDSPLSVGLVFDTSGSMRNGIQQAQSALRALAAELHPEDDGFLVTFSGRPELQTTFTHDIRELQQKFLFSRPGGRTALIDAIYYAVHRIGTAKRPKRAIVVISDGRDNSSRYSAGELTRLVMEADVQIHTIEVGAPPRTKEEILEQQGGTALLKRLAALTGGLHFTIRDIGLLEEAARKLALAMHSRYVLGYYQPIGQTDPWRRIRVKVNNPKELPRVRVSARAGYYASFWQ